MKRFAVIAFLFTLFLGASSGYAQEASKCFHSEWLQGARTVKFTIRGNKLSGAFIVSDQSSGDREYEFAGTRRGNKLTVAFAENKLPDVAPSEMKSLIWQLVRSRGRELLRIKFYGKNYVTNKYEARWDDFEPCRQ